MKNKFNDVVKKASVPIMTIATFTITACSSSVNWTDASQGVHDIVMALISFVGSALGIITVWVLANLKDWLNEWKKKKDAKASKEKKDE